MTNSFDHRKDSPIIHGYSKRLVEFIADNQDGRGWMRKKKREKSEGEGWIQITLEEWKERDSLVRALFLSLGFSFSSPPSSLFNAFRFLTILPSSRFPDHWRRFIDAVSTAQRAERERESAVRAQRLLLYWEARYFDYQRKTNVAVIELERLARLGIISISVLASKPCVSAFISSKLYRKEKRILLEDRGCLL